MRGSSLFLSSLSALALGGALASPAMAQTASDNQAQAKSEEPPVIIVTAERREENLQDVAIAATALSGDQLEDKAVQSLEDLQYAAPAVSITDQGLTQSVNLRGIGIASGSPAVANGVATYIDGIFQPPIVTSSSFYDIASIEVLRGPQGTLVGSNSTGGAIFVNTANPTTRGIEGYAQAHYGSYDAYGAEGAINLPMGETLAVRAAGFTRWRDSYYTDVGPYHNNPDSLDEQAGRLGVMWQPGNFRALGKVEWIDKNTGGYAYRPIEGTAFDNNRRADFRELTYNAPTLNHERAFNSSFEMRYELDSGIVLRSLTGYTNKRINNLYDSDGAIDPGNGGENPNQTQDQFVRERETTQEINIISPTDGKFNWIVGGYYQKNKIDVDITSFAGSNIDINSFNDKLTLGAFAQLGYKILPTLELQVGGRYSHYKVTQTGEVAVGQGGLPVPFPPFLLPEGTPLQPLDGSHKDGRFTGKAALNWNVDDDNLLYVFAARGYKPGGANSATSEFGPETVWDYEFGWKSAFLDNHIRTQFGAFYMDYSDFQFGAFDVTTGQDGGVANISNATIKGFELQAQGKIGGFSFDGGLAYVDSNLDGVMLVNTRLLPAAPPSGRLPQCTPSSPPGTCFDYTSYIGTGGGGPNLFSPKWTYNVGAQYEASLGDDVSITPRVNYAYVGSRWTNLFYNPQLDYLPSRGLLSAQVTLRYGDWEIEAYGTNLADKKYISGQSGNNEFYGAPREYGVRAKVRF